MWQKKKTSKIGRFLIVTDVLYCTVQYTLIVQYSTSHDNRFPTICLIVEPVSSRHLVVGTRSWSSLLLNELVYTRKNTSILCSFICLPDRTFDFCIFKNEQVVTFNKKKKKVNCLLCLLAKSFLQTSGMSQSFWSIENQS